MPRARRTAVRVVQRTTVHIPQELIDRILLFALKAHRTDRYVIRCTLVSRDWCLAARRLTAPDEIRLDPRFAMELFDLLKSPVQTIGVNVTFFSMSRTGRIISGDVARRREHLASARMREEVELESRALGELHEVLCRLPKLEKVELYQLALDMRHISSCNLVGQEPWALETTGGPRNYASHFSLKELILSELDVFSPAESVVDALTLVFGQFSHIDSLYLKNVDIDKPAETGPMKDAYAWDAAMQCAHFPPYFRASALQMGESFGPVIISQSDSLKTIESLKARLSGTPGLLQSIVDVIGRSLTRIEIEVPAYAHIGASQLL